MSTDTNEQKETIVLIVDDVDYTRQLLRNAVLSVANSDQIKTKRFKFINASNGHDTFAKIEQFNPALIFLDIELPDMNGIEILKQIKAKNGKSCVIMVSGESTIDNVKNSLMSGAAGFIVKPFSAVKVSDALKNFEKRKV